MPFQLIRSKREPHLWSILLNIGEVVVEASIPPDTRREILNRYEIDHVIEQETHEIITLDFKKPATAPEKEIEK